MTARTRIEPVEFTMPTPEQTAQVMAEARRLRAEALARLLSRGWSALKGLFPAGGRATHAR